MSTKANTTYVIIDDSRIDLMIVERLLKQVNPDGVFLPYIDSPKALQYVKSLSEDTMTPHVLIVDIQMPLLDGFEFLEAYAKIDKGVQGKTLVLMMSSSTNSADISKAKNLPHVKALLTKPLSVAALQTYL